MNIEFQHNSEKQLNSVEFIGPLQKAIHNLERVLGKYESRLPEAAYAKELAHNIQKALGQRSDKAFKETYSKLEWLKFNFGSDKLEDVLGANELIVAKEGVLHYAQEEWGRMNGEQLRKVA